MEDIFDAVLENEIKMDHLHNTKEEKKVVRNLKGVAAKNKNFAWDNMASSAAVEMNRRKNSHAAFVGATDVEHVRPVLRLIEKYIYAAFPYSFLSTNDPAVIR